MSDTGQETTIPPLRAAQMVTDGLGVLCHADATSMDCGTLAELLRVLEQAETMSIVARAGILGAFTAAQGYEGDGHGGPVPWLMDQAQTTRGRARAQVRSGKKLREHRAVAAAMAAGDIMSSWAEKVIEWTDRLPADCRDDADQILLAAITAGARLEDVAALGCEMYERSRQGTPDSDGPGDGPQDGLDPEAAAFADRSLTLQTTLAGAGVLRGDLAPECAGLLATVLDALSVRAGDGDDRTRAQRYHDALAEACRRLLAAGMMPQRAGQPTKAVVHIPFGALRRYPGASVFEEEYLRHAAARWAGQRAGRRGAASVLGSDGAVWLDGAAAEAAGCDTMTIPIVVGTVDWQALDQMTALCVELAGYHAETGRHASAGDGTGTADSAGTSAGTSAGPGPRRVTPREAELRQKILGAAADLLSGPGGMASVLRTGILGTQLGSRSLPLDIGYSEEIPAAIRRAVILRDTHCAFGTCTALPQSCEVHHIVHKKDGGPTSVTQCLLLCTFHHQILIHRRGWTITLLPDGTTEATSPAGKTVRSHSPPIRPG